MNNTNNNEELLRDVFAEIDLAGAEWSAAKRSALGEFRRARRTRSLSRLSGLLAVFSLSTVLFWPRPQPETLTPAPLLSAAPPAQTQDTPPEKPDYLISDEELLAAFPPGSCFLAEFDGKTRLVFVDERLAREFLH
jgi:hypothetical protein